MSFNLPDVILIRVVRKSTLAEVRAPIVMYKAKLAGSNITFNITEEYLRKLVT